MQKQPTEDLYGTLGVDKKATKKELKKAYRYLAKTYHPDKVNQNPNLSDDQKNEMMNRMSNISMSYNILSDKKARKLYDKTGKVEDLMTFDAEVDNYLTGTISGILTNKFITVKNLIRVAEKIFGDDIAKISGQIIEGKTFGKNLSEILLKKCEPLKNDSKKRKKLKIKMEYIINAQIEVLKHQVEDLEHEKKVSETAFKNLEDFMDDNDERMNMSGSSARTTLSRNQGSATFNNSTGWK